MDSADDRPDGPTDSRPRSKPARPGFASGLPQREIGPRPRVLLVVMGLVLASAACFVVPTVEAATRHRSLRRDLRAALAERAPDYPAEDVASVVTAGLLTIALVGLLFCALEILGARSMLARRTSGRSTLMLAGVTHLPLMFVTAAFRSGGAADIGAVVAQAGTLITALVLSRRATVSDWLEARSAFVLRPLINDEETAVPADRRRRLRR